MKRDAQTEIQGKKFQAYHRIWVETAGQYEACDWMAAHVGHLVANVEQLEKRIRKLERAVFAGRKSRRTAVVNT